ncbi:MAG TPA: hypothetical protein VNI77_08085 [Nitrososphaera sp.]|nr:hypothetical protein [Nitrososphaera sp.]
MSSTIIPATFETAWRVWHEPLVIANFCSLAARTGESKHRSQGRPNAVTGQLEDFWMDRSEVLSARLSYTVANNNRSPR